MPLGERHLRRAIAEYVAHYEAERPHQERGNTLLRPAPLAPPMGRIRRRPRLGGLLASVDERPLVRGPVTDVIRGRVLWMDLRLYIVIVCRPRCMRRADQWALGR